MAVTMLLLILALQFSIPCVSGLKCYCSTCWKTNYTCTTDTKCFSLKEFRNNKLFEQKGCYEGDVSLFACRPFISNTAQAVICCATDMCNRNISLPLQIPPKENPKSKEKPSNGMSAIEIALVIAIPSAFICILGIVLVLWYNRYHQKPSGVANNFLGLIEDQALLNQDNSGTSGELIPSGHTLKDVMEFTMSGSGAGLPVLVQRTVSRQIVLKECIGKGRFGDVHRGIWRSENVAVKIFPSREESSWKREAQIYQTTMLRHENILGFIAADNKDTGQWTQLWLISEYHENGSLYDYLQRVTLSIDELLKILLSISSGLAHLHIEVTGVEGKPSIAHRDIKSKNILVKRDGACCIADLGLAVLHNSSTDSVDFPSRNRIGTKRYLAPEILDDVINVQHFDSFKRADIYATGLVFWEACRRCVVDGKVEEYEPPFYNMVPPDPTIEDMREVVCIERRRPEVDPAWEEHEVMKRLIKIMRECWYHDGPARLTSLRVKKNLFQMWSERGNCM